MKKIQDFAYKKWKCKVYMAEEQNTQISMGYSGGITPVSFEYHLC